MATWIRVVRHVLGLTVRVDRWRAVVVMALVVSLSGVAAVTALSQRWLVDSAGIGSLGGLLGAVAVGAAIHALAAAGFRLQANLRGDLSHLVALHISREVTSAAGRIPSVAHLEVPEYLDRIALVRRGVFLIGGAVWSLAEAAARVVNVGLSIWLLGAVHPILMLTAVIAPLQLYLAGRGRRLVQRATDETAELERIELELHRLCIEPGPAKEIRTSGSGAVVSDHADLLWAQALRRRARAHVRAALLQVAGWIAFAAGFGGAVAVVAVLALEGRASVGDIILVVTLASQLSTHIALSVAGILQLGEAGHVMGQYRWLMEYAEGRRPRAHRSPPDRLRSGITLHGVGFRYPGAAHDVLTGLDLHLPAGSSVALVGVNGAGKTTLVKLLTGMYAPTSGRIEIDGVSLAEIDPDAWYSRTTGTLQDFVKFQLTAGECVGLGDLPDIDNRDRVVRAIEAANAGALAASLPDSLETQLGSTFDGVDLSQGEWQRLALARGYMRTRPLFAVLDEPTAALDPQAEHDLYASAAARARDMAAAVGTIMLLVSHRFSTVRAADLIVVLDGGRVTELGSHAELMSADGTYAEHYRTQARGYEALPDRPTSADGNNVDGSNDDSAVRADQP